MDNTIYAGSINTKRFKKFEALSTDKKYIYSIIVHDNGKITCNCKAGKYNKTECKHIKEIKELLIKTRNRVQAEALVFAGFK